MIEMARIVHNNYEKISDVLFWLNSKWVLKFNVALNKYSDKYGKINYHKEVSYSKQGNECINIIRDFSYYLTLESTYKKYNNEKISIMINNTDFYFFRQNILNASRWFTSSENSNIFVKKGNKIFMPSKIQPISIIIMNSKIDLEPIVYELDNGDQIIGIAIYIDKEDMIFIDVNKFLGFAYFIENFNMFQSAQLMINYLQRPEFGTNLFDVAAYNSYNNSTDASKTSFPKKHDDGLSYFSKINRKK